MPAKTDSKKRLGALCFVICSAGLHRQLGILKPAENIRQRRCVPVPKLRYDPVLLSKMDRRTKRFHRLLRRPAALHRPRCGQKLPKMELASAQHGNAGLLVLPGLLDGAFEKRDMPVRRGGGDFLNWL